MKGFLLHNHIAGWILGWRAANGNKAVLDWGMFAGSRLTLLHVGVGRYSALLPETL